VNAVADASYETTDEDGLRIELDGPVLRLTMNRPDARNAMTPAMWRRLIVARDLAIEVHPQVIILAGAGASFSAGMDKRMFTPEGIPGEKSLISLAKDNDGDILADIDQIQQSFSWLTDIPAITIAVVQGHAVGGGFQIALACDLVFCAEDAQFSMREAAYGLVPDLTGTTDLVQTVGYKRALEICLTTRWVSGSEAVQIGIAVDCVPNAELADRADELVQTLTSRLPGTCSATKALLRAGTTATSSEQRLNERVSQSGRLAMLTKLMG